MNGLAVLYLKSLQPGETVEINRRNGTGQSQIVGRVVTAATQGLSVVIELLPGTTIPPSEYDLFTAAGGTQLIGAKAQLVSACQLDPRTVNGLSWIGYDIVQVGACLGWILHVVDRDLPFFRTDAPVSAIARIINNTGGSS